MTKYNIFLLKLERTIIFKLNTNVIENLRKKRIQLKLLLIIHI